MMLMARVALYEGTWERYHAGTAFVPGNSKWVGHAMYPDFSFKAGSAEDEVNYFLDVAIKASEAVVQSRPELSDDYMSLFTNDRTAFTTDNGEVILARFYLSGVLYHSVGQYLARTGAGTGLTRSLVNSFLMDNGLPIYAAGSGYGGDLQMKNEMLDRDKRLAVKVTGSFVEGEADPITGTVFEQDSIVLSHITQTGNERSTTGYEMTKWMSTDPAQQVSGQGTTANPIFRSAEAMLIYLEAYYERWHDLGGNCDAYWRKLRVRAGVDPDYTKTFAATDLSQENDLAVYSRGTTVDIRLYNIRRERRCELYAEGMRLDDLKRWRSLDNMRNYQVEGINLWGEMYKLWDEEGVKLEEGTTVSPSGLSDYLRPLQITSTLVTYNTGYNFPKPHYLEPIPIAEFQLATVNGKSTLYQNPGWPTNTDGIADYSYDCD